MDTMVIGDMARHLDGLSLSSCREFFSRLSPPVIESLDGFYRGLFTGPGWLQTIAAPGLRWVHFGGWWGKQFMGETRGVNLFCRHGEYVQDFPFTIHKATSLVDGVSGVTIRYGGVNPFPWPQVVDELRTLEDGSLMGMSVANIGPMRKLPLPFLLFVSERPEGA